MSGEDARERAALLAARASYGRLLSWLAWKWRDIAAAEDALADAFEAALVDWPRNGVPRAPDAWLLSVAKRRLIDSARRRRVANDPALSALFDRADAAPEIEAVTDHRLRLMFVCAHPAIAPGLRCALMLQTVLGVEAARIADVSMVSSAAMTKRLTRAKTKIKSAGVRFETPQADELPARVHDVLEAIYGAYTLADSGAPENLAQEAVYLTGLVAQGMPDCAEALGLMALMNYCDARRPARLDADGEFVPLARQDPADWRRDLIDQANILLGRAAQLRDVGPFQLEAAIQSAHCSRTPGGKIPWRDIATLYERLLVLAPTLGARLGHAIARAEATNDADAGLALIDAIDVSLARDHQPWWAARAFLLAKADRRAPALQAYERARALSADAPVRRHLARRIEALRGRLQ